MNLSNEAKSLLIGLLAKNPMKRLGANRGAEEIKEHPFFKDIDWVQAAKRKLNPPPAQIRKIVPQKIPIEQVFENYAGEDKNKLPGWSFVTPQLEVKKPGKPQPAGMKPKAPKEF